MQCARVAFTKCAAGIAMFPRAFWDLVLTHSAIAVLMECMKQACGGCAIPFCR